MTTLRIRPCSGCGNYASFCTCFTPPPQVKVYSPCVQDFTLEADVEITNVCEGLQGEDIVTYNCPHCSGVHDSRRIG